MGATAAIRRPGTASPPTAGCCRSSGCCWFWRCATARDAGFAVACLALAPGYALLVLTAFWVGFTPVGSATVDGIQGRYFLPMHALVLLGLAAAVGAWRPAKLRRGLRLALFPTALALSGAVLAEILSVWKGLWPIGG